MCVFIIGSSGVIVTHDLLTLTVCLLSYTSFLYRLVLKRLLNQETHW